MFSFEAATKGKDLNFFKPKGVCMFAGWGACNRLIFTNFLLIIMIIVSPFRSDCCSCKSARLHGEGGIKKSVKAGCEFAVVAL